MSLSQCQIVELPRISDPRGSLTYIEGCRHIPFDVKRVYYVYDVPGGAERGAHGHRNLQQLIIAISGSFDVILDDGFEKKSFHMNRSYRGLYVAPMIWRDITNVSSGAVVLVLASEVYMESDYFRVYDEFLINARLSL